MKSYVNHAKCMMSVKSIQCYSFNIMSISNCYPNIDQMKNYFSIEKEVVFYDLDSSLTNMHNN